MSRIAFAVFQCARLRPIGAKCLSLSSPISVVLDAPGRDARAELDGFRKTAIFYTRPPGRLADRDRTFRRQDLAKAKETRFREIGFVRHDATSIRTVRDGLRWSEKASGRTRIASVRIPITINRQMAAEVRLILATISGSCLGRAQRPPLRGRRHFPSL